jgi:N4-(beta-N-acetylglucosaminyl)-L-asparaginase
MPSLRRRDFLRTAALTGTAVLAGGIAPADGRPNNDAAPAVAPIPRRAAQTPAGNPVLITSANGKAAAEKAMSMILDGSDALDAVIAGVNIVEDDPNDNSVGYGGLPNEEGVVELDSAVMHGPSFRGGAVASIRNIKNPSKVARLVMERSDHVLIVGEGALKFAKAHGFQEENLLTDKSREIWLKWKETMNTEDDWLPPHDIKDDAIGEMFDNNLRTYGTIHVSALDKSGGISCVTTTSGLAFKIPGRVGDSPIIGAGLYCDNDVGSAGGTGRGESAILSCAAFAIVERMRGGRKPQDACLDVLARVVDESRKNGHVDREGRPDFNLALYAIGKDGSYGSAALWSKVKFAVADAKGARLEEGAFLFEKKS